MTEPIPSAPTPPEPVSADDIGGEFVPVVRSGVLSIELDGEIVLTAPGDAAAGQRSHLLDPTASIVWQCLDGHATIAELAEDVAVVVEGDREQITADLVELFTTLGRAGVLEGVRLAEEPG